MKKLAKLSPAEQVKRCGLDIPPFLQRKIGEKLEYVPIAASPVAFPEMTPAEEFRSRFPLTEHDKEVIAQLLAEEQSHKRDTLNEFLEKHPHRPKSDRKEKRDALVEVKAIAAEMKIEARDARAALRAAKITKPAYGWAFDKKEVAKIKATIKKHLKK